MGFAGTTAGEVTAVVVLLTNPGYYFPLVRLAHLHLKVPSEKWGLQTQRQAKLQQWLYIFEI